MKKLAKAVIKF